jgi:DNA-directed RNA polymerase subunit RPC12/RpoP
MTMNELKCNECKKIIGFSNKDFIHENKKYPTKIRCIDCEFKYNMQYFENLVK